MDIARFIRASFYRVILCRPLTQVYDRFSTKRAGNKALGDRGELAAERFLLRRGHVIVDRGYEARGGEVDLIAVDGRAVVFIEVKTRVSDAKGHPAEAVTFEKQAHLTKAAYAYIKKHNLIECQFRFDIIAVLWPDPGRPPRIEHIENAFEAAGSYQLV